MAFWRRHWGKFLTGVTIVGLLTAGIYYSKKYEGFFVDDVVESTEDESDDLLIDQPDAGVLVEEELREVRTKGSIICKDSNGLELIMNEQFNPITGKLTGYDVLVKPGETYKCEPAVKDEHLTSVAISSSRDVCTPTDGGVIHTVTTARPDVPIFYVPSDAGISDTLYVHIDGGKKYNYVPPGDAGFVRPDVDAGHISVAADAMMVRLNGDAGHRPSRTPGEKRRYGEGVKTPIDAGFVPFAGDSGHISVAADAGFVRPDVAYGGSIDYEYIEGPLVRLDTGFVEVDAGHVRSDASISYNDGGQHCVRSLDPVGNIPVRLGQNGEFTFKPGSQDLIARVNVGYSNTQTSTTPNTQQQLTITFSPYGSSSEDAGSGTDVTTTQPPRVTDTGIYTREIIPHYSPNISF